MASECPIILPGGANKNVLKFDTDIHDFGRIPRGKPVTYTFTFTNSGQTPIIIFEVKPVCGCTIAEYPKAPVKKGEHGRVKVTFNAAHPQQFNKAIVINSNCTQPTKYLTIKGTVY